MGFGKKKKAVSTIFSTIREKKKPSYATKKQYTDCSVLLNEQKKLSAVTKSKNTPTECHFEPPVDAGLINCWTGLCELFIRNILLV